MAFAEMDPVICGRIMAVNMTKPFIIAHAT
jgi:hypothetical protein